MNVQMLWIYRKGAETPELLEAWDEISMEENPEGAKEAFENALAAVGNDFEAFRYINLEIPVTLLDKAFEPYTIKVTGG